MNNRGLVVFVAILLVAGGLIYFFAGNTGFNWYPNYRYNSKQPYGCEATVKILTGINGNGTFTLLNKPLSTSLQPAEVKDGSAYVFIGSELFCDSPGARNLFSFVEKGNDAFIATDVIPEFLNDYLYAEDTTWAAKQDTSQLKSGSTVLSDTGSTGSRVVYKEHRDSSSSEEDPDDTTAALPTGTNHPAFSYQNNYAVNDSGVNMNFIHPALQTTKGDTFSFVYDYKKILDNWHYFYFDNAPAPFKNRIAHITSLGYLNQGYLNPYLNTLKHINFIRVQYGKGFFYLHSNPIVFTNYHLVEPDGFDYATKVFGHLKASNVYWDEASKLPVTQRNDHSIPAQSPLSFILSQPSLRWCWYILLTLLVLFIFFKMKREQQVIPIPEPNLNTSAEFVETIGRLYFLQNDHVALANQKMRLFLQFIRNKYNLSSREADQGFIDRLAEKAHVPATVVNDIFVLYKLANQNTSLSTADLIRFHQAIDKFYKQCK